jgi:hypothetical protein
LAGELFVGEIVVQGARQDLGIFAPRESPQGPDTRIQAHLLHKFLQPPLGILFREALASVVHSDIELQDAVRADVQCVVREIVLDLEVIAEPILTTEFAGFASVFVVSRLPGEAPLLESLRESIGDGKRKNTFPNALRVGHTHSTKV